jgi:DNA adenine methylase
MQVSPQLYQEVKRSEDSSIEAMALKSFIGFGCSFAGKWFGGYAKNTAGTDYCKQAVNSCKKKSDAMLDVVFTNMSYENLYLHLEA